MKVEIHVPDRLVHVLRALAQRRVVVPVVILLAFGSATAWAIGSFSPFHDGQVLTGGALNNAIAPLYDAVDTLWNDAERVGACYRKSQADELFAPSEHEHDLSDIGGFTLKSTTGNNGTVTCAHFCSGIKNLSVPTTWGQNGTCLAARVNITTSSLAWAHHRFVGCEMTGTQLTGWNTSTDTMTCWCLGF